MRISKHIPMKHLGVPAILATAVLVAACGSSVKTITQIKTVQSAAPATATTSTAAATSTPTSTTAASPAAGGSPPCRAAGLSLSYLGGQGATGHGELGFALRNTGTQPCTTIGYPGIQFLDRAGGALPTIPTHTTQDFFGSVPKLFLTVAPGATVSFRLGVTHGAASPSGCTTAYGLQVIPPNDTATLRVSIPNGAYECGTATVSPLASGTSAYS